MRKNTARALAGIPIFCALFVWLTPLSFVPVPWPDDSAFYFVARELFKWPPRWVMLPQAPFEPTYRIWNFNTMPLYPILIGFGRVVGIDGSFLLKLWPLGAWAASGALLVYALARARLPMLLATLVALAFGLDPTLRWASVLVRPESLVGLFGMALVLGLSLGFPERWRARKLWDPVAAMLALGAYTHFNAIHLLFPVVAGYLFGSSQPMRRLTKTGALTVLYLSPWILVVLAKFKLFRHQMELQWTRLAVGNDWLTSFEKMRTNLFHEMGAPETMNKVILHAATGLWILIAVAVLWGLVTPLVQWVIRNRPSEELKGAEEAKRIPESQPTPRRPQEPEAEPISLVPSAAWVIGACWLWTSKPEVWFTYFIHLSLWTFAGLALLRLERDSRPAARGALAGLVALTLAITSIFAYVDVDQLARMSRGNSWRWSVFHDFIDCIDRRLVSHEAELDHPKPFHVWAPTFPDITIELSRRHPDWELTRTNDFQARADLAVQHGHHVEAVVVTESINWAERDLEGRLSQWPDIHSAWLEWKDYFLYRLWSDPKWKPGNRWYCQRGRWQAFIMLNDVPPKADYQDKARQSPSERAASDLPPSKAK
jgi:hypothetical protein